ncbi:hypothetical protein MMC07_003970 [Pseudocyphellaria aurata]|nr:hypothetical protein [Pseudocyphellaria aurata]
MIPVLVLWKVKIQRSQKIFLGMFLCLSLCMIVIAIVRVSGVRVHQNIDTQWSIFWGEVEANVAVIMVSITAFRSLLGLNALKSRQVKERAWYYCRKKIALEKEAKKLNSNFRANWLPAIPGTTVTGIRTQIWGNRNSKEGVSETNLIGSIDDRRQVEKQITVTQKISSESEAVRFPLPKEHSIAVACPV